MQQNHTKFGTHNHMLVLLLQIEENAKGTISKCCLACDIFLLLYLFSSFVLVIFYFLKRNEMEIKKRNEFISKAHNIARKKK